MEPVITITLKEYERLKDLEYQMRFLIDKVEIKENKGLKYDNLDPLQKPYPFLDRIGLIDKKNLDYFYKNLLDIDDLVVRGEEND